MLTSNVQAAIAASTESDSCTSVQSRSMNTGNWSEDTRAGRKFAEACIQQMKDLRSPCLLAPIARQMLLQEKIGGVEVGFFSKIAEQLIR